jgi:hypothetical protein
MSPLFSNGVGHHDFAGAGLPLEQEEHLQGLGNCLIIEKKGEREGEALFPISVIEIPPQNDAPAFSKRTNEMESPILTEALPSGEKTFQQAGRAGDQEGTWESSCRLFTGIVRGWITRNSNGGTM